MNTTTQNAVPERWKPILGELYYFIDSSGRIHVAAWLEDKIDEGRFNTFNCFKTEAEAQHAADRRLIDAEYRAYCRACNKGVVVDWTNKKQQKWVIFGENIPYENPNNEMQLKVVPTFLYLGIASCAFVGPNAEANARKALELFGERLKLLTTP